MTKDPIIRRESSCRVVYRFYESDSLPVYEILLFLCFKICFIV
jgi:hypothetical protein